MAGRNAQNKWNALDYLIGVESLQVRWFQEYQVIERSLVQAVPELPRRTVIDAGAGEGRMLSHLADRTGEIVAVELNQEMFSVLEKRVLAYSNVIALNGDFTRLESLLGGKDICKPLVLCLQNTLGTVTGNLWDAICQFRKVAESKGGDVVISVFNAEAFEEYGIPFYEALSRRTGMIGKIDFKRTDKSAGKLVTSTGYKSQWFDPGLRQKIREKLGGELAGEYRAKQFTIMRFAYERRV